MKIFISYSHKDKSILEKLETHLTMLKRDGLISLWSDKEIKAGGHLNAEIANAQQNSMIFMPIVSPDFLDSNYCYEIEMETALQKEVDGDIRIMPIIAEPCDWLNSPLSNFKALPEDGRPISNWTNQNSAYLNVAQELRKLIQTSSPSQLKDSFSELPETRKVKIKKTFSSIDKANFRDKSFEKIEEYFAKSCNEISLIDGIQTSYENMHKNAFTATIVNREKIGAESSITIHNNKNDNFSFGDITIVYSAHASAGTSNERISIEHDDYKQFLTFDMFHFHNNHNKQEDEQKLTADKVAETIWNNFVSKAGIDYE
jgi:hypothetical protein